MPFVPGNTSWCFIPLSWILWLRHHFMHCKRILHCVLLTCRDRLCLIYSSYQKYIVIFSLKSPGISAEWDSSGVLCLYFSVFAFQNIHIDFKAPMGHFLFVLIIVPPVDKVIKLHFVQTFNDQASHATFFSHLFYGQMHLLLRNLRVNNLRSAVASLFWHLQRIQAIISLLLRM